MQYSIYEDVVECGNRETNRDRIEMIRYRCHYCDGEGKNMDIQQAMTVSNAVIQCPYIDETRNMPELEGVPEGES